MKTIYLSVLFLLFSSISMIAQEKGILLQKKGSERTDFLLEHKRIKVVTTEGKSFFGRFKIIDERTISINNIPIPLTSIAKIKRKSFTATITAPIVCAAGIILILSGTAVAVVGGDLAIVGLGLMSTGFTLPIVTLVSNKHPKNHWQYAIGEIPPN